MNLIGLILVVNILQVSYSIGTHPVTITSYFIPYSHTACRGYASAVAMVTVSSSHIASRCQMHGPDIVVIEGHVIRYGAE